MDALIKINKGYRGRLCSKHIREKHGKFGGVKKNRSKEIQELTLKPCSVCGWDKTVNDVHRVIAGRDGYEIDNCITLCPNCHRLHHLGVKTKNTLDIVI